MCRRTYNRHRRIARLELPIPAAVLLAGLLLGGASVRPVAAQVPDAVGPTTVQLPTFSSFSVDTSVSVPDSGGAYSEAARRARQQPYYPGLKPAGANIGSYNAARAGQGGSGARGSAITGSALSVRATIHDPPSDHGTSRSRANTNVDVERFATALAAARESTAGRPALSVKQAHGIWLAEQPRRIGRDPRSSSARRSAQATMPSRSSAGRGSR